MSGAGIVARKGTEVFCEEVLGMTSREAKVAGFVVGAAVTAATLDAVGAVDHVHVAASLAIDYNS